MGSGESTIYLIEPENEGAPKLSKGVVWSIALALGLVVDIGIVMSAVHLARHLWA